MQYPELQSNLIEVIEPIIRQAGELVRSHFGGIQHYSRKADRSILTQADVECEQFLLEKLVPVMPEAGFVGEETGQHEAVACSWQWVVDPIDGTTNFAHGFPYYCISIGLSYCNEPMFGAIYNPSLDELFHAQKGRGAFLGSKKLQVSKTDKVSSSVVSVGVPCSRHDCDVFWQSFKAVQDTVHSYRKLGAAALDMASVAAGRLDGALFGRLSWWDVVAGTVLVREAGGRVGSFDTDEIGPNFRTCLVSNGLLHDELRRLVGAIPGEI